ncbi:DUF2637 domain-containing protein [Streptomyces sp. NPDC002845]
MNDERMDRHAGYYADHLGQFGQFGVTGTGRHRHTAEAFQAPLVPPDPAWDPAEELAYMLQDAMEGEHAPTMPPARSETSAIAPPGDSHVMNLQETTAELPPLSAVPRVDRRVRPRRGPSGLRTVSYMIAALAAIITSMVSAFGGLATYEPLRLVAVSHTYSSAVSWWPLLVYGPWLVAALSILRAALSRRRAAHSWVVIVLFSLVAVFLCVAQAPRTITGVAAAVLPSCASLACFQQFVRQITMTRPNRRSRRRHRMRFSPVQSGPRGEPRSPGLSM